MNWPHSLATIGEIAQCHFKTFRVDGNRIVSKGRIFFFGALPVTLSVAIVLKFDQPGFDTLQTILAVYAVLIAVLVGTIPLAHGIIGQVDSNKKYEYRERGYANNEVNRVCALQDVIASISYASLWLVVSFCASIPLVFLLPPEEAKTASAEISKEIGTRGVTANFVRSCFCVLVYHGGIVAVLAFYDISSGVFLAMERYSNDLRKRVLDNVVPRSDQIVDIDRDTTPRNE